MIEEMKDFVKATWRKFALLFVVFFIAGIGLGIYVGDSLMPKTRTVSTMHVVKAGDTLIDICYEYRAKDCREPYIFEFMDEVKALNPYLEERQNQLQVGDKIMIEYKERE